MYIHERENWTDFRWDKDGWALLLEEAGRKQGLLYGRLGGLGIDSRMTAMAENLTQELTSSSEIEGISLNMDMVRSSIVRRLGVENDNYVSPSRYIDSVVAAMLDAVEHYDQELTKEKLCGWQTAFFPIAINERLRIVVGEYRNAEEQVVSGMFGKEKVHYIAPAPDRVEEEMRKFLEWFNSDSPESFIIRSAVAHLWFVSIHPFEDGNGRLARILSDMMLARGDKSGYRFYNVSSAINRDKRHYYDVLERTTSGDGDITEWLEWYLRTLITAIEDADTTVSTVLNKSFFWQRTAGTPMTERQTRVLNLFLDGYEAKITSKTWANLANCSKDTAIRDIQDLVGKNILCEDVPGSKRPSYSIVYDPDDISPYFSDVSITNEATGIYLTAIYKGRVRVRERILKLDAERLKKGELSLSHLLSKYCSYLIATK